MAKPKPYRSKQADYGTKPPQIHAYWQARREGNWPGRPPMRGWMVEMMAERQFRQQMYGNFNRRNKPCRTCGVLMPVTGRCDNCA